MTLPREALSAAMRRIADEPWRDSRPDEEIVAELQGLDVGQVQETFDYLRAVYEYGKSDDEVLEEVADVIE